MCLMNPWLHAGPTAEAPQALVVSFDAPLPQASLAGRATRPAAASEATDNADDTLATAEITLYRTRAVPAAPNASWPTAVASVWPSNVGIRVPETFLATSHEWRRIKDYGGANVQAWASIFKMLSDSPVLRIGGASQDAMTEAPGPDVWSALLQLQRASSCR
eukprot:GHUV01048032.1.p1 GENE.GHUV01048032.1~~GHUV01048032.1.p1  ORF type:complete len:162 (+),score=35.00 GHUV01048032.1:128-613(+)